MTSPKKFDFLLLTKDYVLDFGKYNGRTIASVADQDPDYVLWLEHRFVDYHLANDIKHQCEDKVGIHH